MRPRWTETVAAGRSSTRRGERRRTTSPNSIELQPQDAVRRSAYAFFRYVDSGLLDVRQLLRGAVEVTPTRQLLAISPLTGGEHPVELEDLELLSRIPAGDWVEVADVGADPEAMCELAFKGVVVTDVRDGRLAELRRREERLEREQWSPYAALYHFLTPWRVDSDSVPDEWIPTKAELERGIDHFVARFGAPPPAFAGAGGSSSIDLPAVTREGDLYSVLARRVTTRSFDESRPVSLEQLSAVLDAVFGCHGFVRLSRDLLTLRKTSPSGGALHPIEVYPLVASVNSVEPGLYHYDVERHALGLLEALDRERVRELMLAFTAGQTHFRAAHVLFVLAARFYRSFWKYRRLGRAYAALYMDAGHLSQTLYLVCTELGLGAFVTAAVDAAALEEQLGLDGVGEGVLAVCGCGVPGPPDPLDDPVPYVPRQTRV